MYSRSARKHLARQMEPPDTWTMHPRHLAKPNEAPASRQRNSELIGTSLVGGGGGGSGGNAGS